MFFNRRNAAHREKRCRPSATLDAAEDLIEDRSSIPPEAMLAGQGERMKKLYIGNLPYQATEADLQSWFAEAGVTVDTVTLMRDRYSGEARGFGFVELPDGDADRAIQGCNGKDFLGRTLVVNEARPLREGGGGGGGSRPGGAGRGRGAGGRA
jgi:RNA recognition motif-containing protein